MGTIKMSSRSVGFRIFLSSPGDVRPERDAVHEVILEINASHEFDEHFELSLYRWDDKTVVLPLSATKTPQESVDEFLIHPAKCDLIIVIFWSRMGTPLTKNGKEYLSGTFYEYTEALEAHNSKGKPVIWIFRYTEIPQISPEDTEKLIQYERVQDFFREFTDDKGQLKGFVHEYNNREEFKNYFRKVLKQYLSSLQKKQMGLNEKDIDNRKQVLSKVRQFWVESVLAKSLPKNIFLEFAIKEQFDVLDKPEERYITTKMQEAPFTLSQPSDISMIFEKMGSQLLILGEPGGGKTTILLLLARQLLDHADNNLKAPIPVVLSLVSWTSISDSFESWVIFELQKNYGIKPEIGDEWLNNDRLLLLLDALDEVDIKYRNDCVAEINKFRLEHGPTKTVITSRRTEYKALSNKLKLEGAINVEPLSLEQIQDYLTTSEGKYDSILSYLRANSILRDLIINPLILHILVTIHENLDTTTLTVSESEEAYEKLLFDRFVQRMLEKRPRPVFYEDNEIIKNLHWFASVMQKSSQAKFLVETLQIELISEKWIRQLYFVLCGFAYGLITSTANLCAVYLILSFSMSPGQSLLGAFLASLAAGIAGGMSIGVAIGLSSLVLVLVLAAFITNPVSAFVVAFAIGFIIVMFSSYGRATKTSHPFGLKYQIIGGVLAGMLVSLIPLSLMSDLSLNFMIYAGIILGGISGWVLSFRLDHHLNRLASFISSFSTKVDKRSVHNYQQGLIITVDHIQWSWAHSLAGLFVATPLALLLSWQVSLQIAVAVAVSIILLTGIAGLKKDVDETSEVNQGIKRSFVNALKVFAFLSIVVGIVFTLSSNLINGILAGAATGLVGFLAYGGIASISHFILRLIFWKKDATPINFAKFLDHSASLGLLRKVGGGYIFMHRKLLDYFADSTNTKMI
jgi:eukaryotic-like serine/threonine-protein kinase